MGAVTGWDTLPATSTVAPAGAKLNEGQKRLLSHIHGLGYGFFQKRRGDLDSPTADCFVVVVLKGRRGKQQRWFRPVWRLNPIEERPLLAVGLSYRRYGLEVERGGQVYASDGLRAEDGLVHYLPIDEFVLTRRMPVEQIAATLEKARSFTQAIA